MALFLRFHDANPIDFGHLPTWENYNKENLNSKAHARRLSQSSHAHYSWVQSGLAMPSVEQGKRVEFKSHLSYPTNKKMVPE